MGDRLIEDRQPVAHRAIGRFGDHRQRLGFGGHALLGADPGEMLGQQPGRNAPQVKTLAARQHRDRQLVDLGRGKQELHMRRRLFQRLEQGVEGVAAEHVDFVDDVDLVARGDRRIAHRLDDLAHVVDTGVAGRVHLDHVDVAALGDRHARLAHPAGVDRRPALPVRADAVECLGDQPRSAGLAHPAYAGHQEGMGQPVPADRVGQGLDHRVLPDQRGECLRAVLAGEHPVGLHRRGRSRCDRSRRQRRGRNRFAKQRRLARRLEFGGAGAGLVVGRVAIDVCGIVHRSPS